jgi:topoisomerase-4 subunit B
MEVEVARDRTLFGHAFERGKPVQKLKNLGPIHNRRGTTVRFRPDPEIFGKLEFSRRAAAPALPLQGLSLSAASRSAGPATRPRRRRHPGPGDAALSPGGLADFLGRASRGAPGRPRPLCGEATFPDGAGRCEWASPGWSRARASSRPMPTPSRRRRAARMRPGCAPRW